MPTLGDRIRQAREALGYTQPEIAKRIGLTQQGYSDIESGKSKRPRGLEKIARALNTTPEYLQFGSTGARPVYLIPMLSWAEAPLPHTLDILEKKEGVLAMDTQEKNRYYALTIKDDSMTSKSGDKRSFLEGDTIIVDPLFTPKHGSYVVIREPEASEAILKQYLVHGGTILLSSLNDRYPTIKHNDSIVICGVVIQKIEKIEKY